MTVKCLKTIEYGRYYIAVGQHPDKIEFTVYYNEKKDKPKIKSFFY